MLGGAAHFVDSCMVTSFIQKVIESLPSDGAAGLQVCSCAHGRTAPSIGVGARLQNNKRHDGRSDAARHFHTGAEARVSLLCSPAAVGQE